MRRSICLFVPMAGLIFGGCGGPDIPATGSNTVPPHGGAIVDLGDSKGLVEVVKQSKGDGRDRQAESTIVAYFLRADGKAAMDQAPGEVEAVITVDGKPKTVKMTAEPQTSDPLGTARFVSPPGRYGGEQVDGRLEAVIGGAKTPIPFLIR